MSVPAITVPSVKQIVKVRMLPTEVEAAALEATLRTCNEAASWLSAEMHAKRLHHKHDAQKRFYRDLRQRFGLSAQPTIRVIGKVANTSAAPWSGSGTRLHQRKGITADPWGYL